MQSGWLSRVGAWTVEHVPCPHPNVLVDLSVPAKGVQHTTEGATIEGALSVFRRANAPHFLVGRDVNRHVRILQLIPLGYIGAALEHHGAPPTNGWARAQIELVGFAQHLRWKPDTEVAGALAALYGALAQAAGIPLDHVANPGRDARTWELEAGWFGHVDVPGNSHWDPGRLDYDALFARVQPVPPKVKPRPKPVVLHPLTWRLRRRSNGLVYVEPLDRPH